MKTLKAIFLKCKKITTELPTLQVRLSIDSVLIRSQERYENDLRNGSKCIINVCNCNNYYIIIKKKKKIVTQSRTGLQIYEGHDDQLDRPGPMA
jgi:hypothetical protein